MTEGERFQAKARESLASARADLRARRYNSAANRAYYAAFQAAVAALIRAAIRPANDDWNHRFVMSRFSGTLVRRRKLLPGAYRRTLSDLFLYRATADYRPEGVSASDAREAVMRSGRIVKAVGALEQRRAREARSMYGSERVTSKQAVRAKATELVDEVKQAVLQKYPDCEFKLIELSPKDYRLIVRSDSAGLGEIIDLLDGRTADMLVDHDIWIVVMVESKQPEAA